MRIGFIKFGLKTYFESNGSGQGSNHELVDIFDIFEKQGHQCFMISGSDKYEKFTDIESLDYLFVFNGPWTKYEGKGIIILEKYFKPYLEIINNTKIPYIYFWTDPDAKYDIRTNKLFNRQPSYILSQEKEFYGHLDKLVFYNKQPINQEKTVFLSTLMNNTNNKRSKLILKYYNFLELWYKNLLEIRGNWGKETNKYLKESIKENEVINYLSTCKYGLNINKNPKWVSQKFNEYLLAGTICFYKDYDEDCLVLPQDNFQRIRHENDLIDKIQYLEKNPEKYQELIKEYQTTLIKPEYITGQIVYKTIINLTQSNA